MAKKAFDLGTYLKPENVSKLNTDEQIVRIDLDLIDPDPANFYSLEGIDELAANIELVGLLDALRVRPNGTRYTVVSGHRRRAAIMLIRDCGSEQFKDGVPCIVEYGAASPAMRELRLIYANSATRVMSSADLSKQAERVTELLYELKAQGVEFPGRMREHVAAACRVSESKIARVSAIRKNLTSALLERFDRGEIVESVAYRISQEAENVQKDLAAKCGDAVRILTADHVDSVIEQVKKPKTEERVAEGVDPYRDKFDAEAYLAERAAEDRKYFEMLEAVADTFLPGLYKVNARHTAIDLLKQGYKNRGCWSGPAAWDGSGKGLTLWEKYPDNHRMLRTWTEVYDMLCSIAINRCAAAIAKEDE